MINNYSKIVSIQITIQKVLLSILIINYISIIKFIVILINKFFFNFNLDNIKLRWIKINTIKIK